MAEAVSPMGWEARVKRRGNGSVNPAGIIAPAIVATFISTLTAVVYCKGKDRRGLLQK